MPCRGNGVGEPSFPLLTQVINPKRIKLSRKSLRRSYEDLQFGDVIADHLVHHDGVPFRGESSQNERLG